MHPYPDSGTVFLAIQFVIVVIVLACATIIRRQKHSLHEKIFEDIARHRNGKVIKSSFLYSPKLKVYEFDCQTEIFTTPGGKKTPPHTHFKSQLKSPHSPQVVLYREDALTRVGKLFGLQDIQIHDAEFDPAFLIKGSDEGFVLSLLTLEIRNKLLAWKNFYPILKLDGNTFELTIATRLKERERFDGFISTGLMILRRIGELSY